MKGSILGLITGFISYLNPFDKEFSGKEEIVYCSRRQGPTGLWEKLPRLHYHLFNQGKKYLLKTDVELQAGKIDPSKKAVVMITDDARGSVYGASFGDLVEQLKTEFNVVGIYLHENPQNICQWKDVVTVGPLERGDLGAVVAEEIKSLQNLSEVEAVAALSLEVGDVLPNVWGLGVPILHYIHEFLVTPRQIKRLKKSRRDSTLQFFQSEEIRTKALAISGIKCYRRSRVLEVAGSEGFISQLNRLSVDARSLLAVEKKECSEIKASGLLDPRYAYPQIEVSGDRPIRDYLAGWRSGWKTRKPCPGFHPGVYRDHNSDLEGDPTINFIRNGKHKGPWTTEVLHLTEAKKSIEVPLGQTALHLHFHYTEGIEGLLRKIKGSQSKPDLFISTTREEGKMAVKKLLETLRMSCRELEVFPNRGRDIGPFLTGFGPKLFCDYEIVGHLHSKKSPHSHDDYLKNWVEFLEKGLIGEKGRMMDTILAKMNSDSSIGIVYPDDPGCFGWESNYAFGEVLLKRMGLPPPDQGASINFPVGTMFWARTAALMPLVDLDLKWEDYPEEPLPIDGSMLHALERIFGLLPNNNGFRTVLVAVKEISR
jgi:hypothetical protein